MSMLYRTEVLQRMSDYKPITKELVDMMDYYDGNLDMPDIVSASSEDFFTECSKIDSIHEKLEDENQSLKNIIAKLKHNTTVMELFCKNLEDAVKERKDVTLWGFDYIPVPVDADNVPIHNGDLMEYSDGKTFRVVGIGNDTLYYIDDETRHIEWTSIKQKRHYRSDTWEKIIEDAIKLGYTDPDNEHLEGKLVKRCKTLAGDVE